MAPKDSSSTNSAIAKLGRKGDPRMHRAVAARLASPDLPLLDALRQGGFEFPAANGEHDSTLVDADGVTLGQRKNQLSRRLRLAKKDESAAEGNKKAENIINSNANRTSVTVVSSTGAPLQGHHFSQTFLKEGVARKRFRRASFSENGDAEDDVDMADDSMDRKAKYHPEYHPLFPPVHPRMDLGGLAASTPASGVAVASLISTANTVGMTLEQLAMRLSNSPNLFASLSHTPDPEERLTLAVNLVKTDSRAIIQKSMLHAGYETSQIVEGSPAYMKVALKLWEGEGKRLESLLGCHNNRQELCECLPGVGAAAATSHHAHGGASHHCHSDHDCKGAEHQCGPDFQGRHVHRLSGKCGHKAIIHQPPGKPAHIDFVVDGQIECYEGIKPVGPKGQGAMWPSRYKCIDLACPTDPQKQMLACGSTGEQVSESVPDVEPKQLSLTDVDFDGKEWNVDFFCQDGQDDTLQGLIKLGDGEPGNIEESSSAI